MKSQENGVHVGISATNKTQYSDDNVRVELESLDESLNVKRKKPNGRKTNRLILAVIAIVAVIFAAVIGVNVINNNSKKRSDTLNIVLKLAPTNLDIRTQSGSSLDQVLIGNVYEGLVARNEENKVVPALAKSWDVSEDGLTYTFHMAKSAHFSNGKTLDAYTAAASIQQLIDKQYRDYDKLSAVQTITALDPTTLKFQLKTPDANLLWNLTGRAGLVLEPTATNDLKTSAIGSGPYVVKKFVNNSSIQLQANSQYWGNHAAKTNTINIRYISDDTAALHALTSGDAQIVSPVNEQLAKTINRQNYTVKVGDGTDKYVLAMNNKGANTSDIRIRQAIRYGIDHKALIAARGGSDLALGGPIPSLDPGYEDLTKIYPHDVAKAQELMRQAGYSASHPLTLQLTYANVYGQEIGEQLRSQLSKIYIDLKVNVVEFSTWLQDVYTNHAYDLSLVDHNESHDFSNWADGSYYFGYDNAKVQELYEKAKQSDDSTMRKYLAQAARIVSEDAAADWLFNYRITTAMAQGVEGFPMNMNQTVMPLYNVVYES